jgi:hypothetical protein
MVFELVDEISHDMPGIQISDGLILMMYSSMISDFSKELQHEYSHEILV